MKTLLFKLPLVALAAVAALATGGCASLQKGMFAPRSGELFQTTRMGPGLGSAVGMAPMYAGFMLTTACPLLFPLVLVGFPIAGAGLVLDECVVSPLTDIVCLPYDLCQPCHGIFFQVVDENGQPIPGANVYGALSARFFDPHTFSETTNESGECYLSRLHADGDCRVKKSGYAAWYDYLEFNPKDIVAGCDGRKVLRLVLLKDSPGGWEAQTDLSREEFQALLPGKWTADESSRKWLKFGFHCPVADDPACHCFTLNATGTASVNGPDDYRYYQQRGTDAPCWKRGRSLTFWKCHEQQPTSSVKGTWRWAVSLSSEPSQDPRFNTTYFLGKDAKGLYLSPGPFEFEETTPKLNAVLKYRKAN